MLITPRYEEAEMFTRRATFLWPRLERRSLAHCNGDPYCIARQVAHRTPLPELTIVRMLTEGIDADPAVGEDLRLD